MGTVKNIIDNANQKIESMYSSVENMETLDNVFEVIRNQISEGLTLAAERFFKEEEITEMENACIKFSYKCFDIKRNEIIEATRKNFVLL